MWQLAAKKATLRTDRLALSLDVDQPQQGCGHVELDGDPIAHMRLFQLRFAVGNEVPPLVDYYVRGADLVATYTQTPAHSVRPQIYWRDLSAGDYPGLEIIASMQTSLLDSAPNFETESAVDNAEVLGLQDDHFVAYPDAPCWAALVRPREAAFSYLEMVHPSDFVASQVRRSDAGTQFGFQLFSNERLEKGVIRRGRLRGLFLERECDIEAALASVHEFNAAKLPLTT